MSKRKKRRQLLAAVTDTQEHRRVAGELAATRGLLKRALELLALYGCMHRRNGCVPKVTCPACEGTKKLRKQMRQGEEE